MVATVMNSALTPHDLVQGVVLAHCQTCDLTTEKVKVMREIALLKNDYVDCPAHMVLILFQVSLLYITIVTGTVYEHH